MMTDAEESRNWNRPDAERRPAEWMNESRSAAQEDADFQDHVTKRADGARRQANQGESSVIERNRFARQLEGISDERRARVLSTAEDLARDSEQSDEQAVLNALGEETDQRAPRTDQEVTSPDVSLEHPHGPEGASHGGRTGRDPMQYVEDSTPSGTNAYSQTRGGPERRKRSQGPER